MKRISVVLCVAALLLCAASVSIAQTEAPLAPVASCSGSVTASCSGSTAVSATRGFQRVRVLRRAPVRTFFSNLGVRRAARVSASCGG